MRQLVYDPIKSGPRMTIVCFVSGSGTNYREIVKAGPDHRYLVFTNRPGCGAIELARRYRHEIIEFNHIPYLKEARKKYGQGNVPRNVPERVAYEKEAVRLIENQLGQPPDLICMAGYDQWNTDWMIDRYFPRILNIHPGDTTKGYILLHWIPIAQAILAGEPGLRSTLFFVDKSEDNGPVLVQSAPLPIIATLKEQESKGESGLLKTFSSVADFAQQQGIKTFQDFKEKAGEDMMKKLEVVSSHLQDSLKIYGDWKIYPLAVHGMIAKGRVAVDGRDVYIDSRKMPIYGYRPDEQQ